MHGLLHPALRHVPVPCVLWRQLQVSHSPQPTPLCLWIVVVARGLFYLRTTHTVSPEPTARIELRICQVRVTTDQGPATGLITGTDEQISHTHKLLARRLMALS